MAKKSEIQKLNEAITSIENVKTAAIAAIEEIEKAKQPKPVEVAVVPPTESGFDCLAVTAVNVYPFKEGPSLGHIKGLANIVINDQIQIRGLRVMEGENGLFVGYPTDPFYKGEDFKSICMPITRMLREHIENCVLEKYKVAIE